MSWVPPAAVWGRMRTSYDTGMLFREADASAHTCMVMSPALNMLHSSSRVSLMGLITISAIYNTSKRGKLTKRDEVKS